MLTSPLADLLPSILPDSPDSDQPVQEGHAGDTSRDHQDRMKEPMLTDLPAHAPHDPRMISYVGENTLVLSS